MQRNRNDFLLICGRYRSCGLFTCAGARQNSDKKKKSELRIIMMLKLSC
jgi:hypothetical protein